MQNKSAHLTAVRACSCLTILVGFSRVSYRKWSGMILTAVGDLRRYVKNGAHKKSFGRRLEDASDCDRCGICAWLWDFDF